MAAAGRVHGVRVAHATCGSAPDSREGRKRSRVVGAAAAVEAATAVAEALRRDFRERAAPPRVRLGTDRRISRSGVARARSAAAEARGRRVGGRRRGRLRERGRQFSTSRKASLGSFGVTSLQPMRSYREVSAEFYEIY